MMCFDWIWIYSFSNWQWLQLTMMLMIIVIMAHANQIKPIICIRRKWRRNDRFPKYIKIHIIWSNLLIIWWWCSWHNQNDIIQIKSHNPNRITKSATTTEQIFRELRHDKCCCLNKIKSKKYFWVEIVEWGWGKRVWDVSIIQNIFFFCWDFHPSIQLKWQVNNNNNTNLICFAIIILKTQFILIYRISDSDSSKEFFRFGYHGYIQLNFWIWFFTLSESI